MSSAVCSNESMPSRSSTSASEGTREPFSDHERHALLQFTVIERLEQPRLAECARELRARVEPLHDPIVALWRRVDLHDVDPDRALERILDALVERLVT